ncbi:MAG: gliding motility protein GldB [Candidatus Azobacteroides sp.]|nr:gliding motility protein GldB [Candidatus Azobacteroides sp.]
MKKQIRTILRIGLLGVACLCCIRCSGNKTNEESPEFTIIRFDTDLYRYLTQNLSDSDLQNHNDFLNIFGEGILAIGKSDSAGFYSRLKAYFSEPTLMGIYRDEQEKFADLTDINKELSKGLYVFLQQFPQIKPPKIYMHVSGFNQNVVVTDDILSLSADKYLGADYPVYQNFFYDYQRQQMTPDRIVPDYLLGFMMANLPFSGDEDVLLDRILYEGKLRYMLSQLLPDRQDREYVGYDKEQYEWCMQYQSLIWKTILENHHLFTGNYITTTQYLKEAPYTAYLPAESPGRVGIWLGYQIISAYMKQKPKTGWQELMDNTDYPEILKQSKYKPQ